MATFRLTRSLTVAFAMTLLAAGALMGAEGSAPSWPSLEQQLAAAHAVPGSALDRLIRENQDFSLLHAGEAADTIPVPPWLRVWYRRAHPKLEYAATNPTGGYPLVLKEVLEWMVSHQDLVSDPRVPEAEPEGPLPVSGRGVGEPESLYSVFEAIVDTDRKINGSAAERRSESDIRVNYADAARIVSASNNITGSWQGMYYSTDGGTTWGQTLLPGNGSDSFHSDPTVDWSSDGTVAWSTTMGIESGGAMRIKAYRSTTNGASWTFDGTISGSDTNTDKQMAWMDHSASSSYRDQIYAIWHNGTTGRVNRRTSAGWQTPLSITSSETTGTPIGADIKTNSYGDVFAMWPDTGSRGLYVRKSTNGGASYATAVKLRTTYDSYDIGVPSMNSRRALIYVTTGAYRTASKNLVYATWTDLSGETGCTTASNEPGSSVSSSCKTRIWFARSTDGGTTWSSAIMINHQATKNDQFNQWMVVDEATGALAIIYYDSVNDPARLKTDVWYQRSWDDGLTWSTPVKVTSAMTDETSSGSDSGNQYGDYNGLSGYNGFFFPSWTDRRTTGSGLEEIWTAKITDKMCTTPGDPTVISATVPGDNQITIQWNNGSPSATTFNVYRALGDCSAPGSFTLLAGGVSGTSTTDTTVQGGVTYAYRVSGVDSTGGCESAPSTSCVSATATGPCTAAPWFAGVTSVTAPESTSCTLDIAWAAATPLCGGSVTYRLYRDTDPAFTPAAGNLIASDLTGTTYSDAGSLEYGTTYTYVVRAVDVANAAEDANVTRRAGSPHGLGSTWSDTLEPAPAAGWSHAVAPGVGTDDWATSTAASHSATHAWASADVATRTDKWLIAPAQTLPSNATLTFWHQYSFESGFDGGVLEISANGGSTWVDLGSQITGGGYTSTISSSYSNPLMGRQAWSGSSSGFVQVTVSLASYAGQSVLVRWRMGCDTSLPGGSWYIDDIVVQGFESCAAVLLALQPAALQVDGVAGAGSNGNGVLEPGEQISVVPSWRNPNGVGVAASGSLSSFTGPGTPGYTIVAGSAGYGTIAAGASAACAAGQCYELAVGAPSERPASHWDATVVETLSSGATKTWMLHIGGSFTDLETIPEFVRFIETIFHAGVTLGCETAKFCPMDELLRGHAAVFIARARAGSDAAVPLEGNWPGKGDYSCHDGGTSFFKDVAATDYYCPHVHYAASLGITLGCTAESYCPHQPVSRAQTAMLLARAMVGSDAAVPVTYTDTATGLTYSCSPSSPNVHFLDVDPATDYCRHAHYLWARGVLSGCASSPGPMFCPADTANRMQMAKLLTNTFDLKLYTP